MEPDRVSDEGQEVSDDGSHESPMKKKVQEKVGLFAGMKNFLLRKANTMRGKEDEKQEAK